MDNRIKAAGGCFAASLKILEEIATDIQCNFPVDAYIAGGQATIFWCEGYRSSLDLDVVFSHKVLVKQGLSASIAGTDFLSSEKVVFDYNFRDAFALVHADYPERAHRIGQYGQLNIKIISPVDLAIMKTSRLSEDDRLDICALIDNNLLDKNEYITLANDAILDFVGNLDNVRYNISEVAKMIQAHENAQNQNNASEESQCPNSPQ